MKAPKECTSMAELRLAIDALDKDLIERLALRAAYIDRAASLKEANGWPARIPSRVEEVVSNVRRHASEQSLDPDLVETIWRGLIDWSIAREEAKLGPDSPQS